MKKKGKNFWGGLTSIMAIVLSLAIGLGGTMFANPGAINEALGIKASTEITRDGEYTYKTAYTEDGKPNAEGLKQLIADQLEYCKTELAEGSVLLENNGALPLAENERRVSLFGRASVDPVYRGSSGGAKCNDTYVYNWKKAMTDAGFSINEELYNAYASSGLSRVTMEDSSADIAECPASFYTSAVQSSYASDYRDAAIVILSRLTGEGHDGSVKDKDGLPMLALHQQEKDMLSEVQRAGFEKTIVIVNSAAPMELGTLEEYGVDAVLWIGYPGYYGLPGVVSVLTGESNPSGRLVDVAATDSLSSPAMMNWGDYSYAGDAGSKYVVYAEGIYVGYKYYETRYEDCVLQQGNAAATAGVYASSDTWNYADEVLYPFGYGLSYTSFEQELVPQPDGKLYTYDEEADEFRFTVQVTNTGASAGKEVVQLYAQQPYTQYDQEQLVEKAAVQIVGFAKTGLLEPGASETVEISVPRYYLASYDANGAKGYILDDGSYYFAIGSDAHDALNNILCAKGATGMTDARGKEVMGDAAKTAVYELEEFDAESYKASPYTGVEVTNLFEDADVNYYYDADVVTYLSRRDWQGTYPQTVQLTMNDKIKAAMNMDTYTGEHQTDLKDVVYGKDQGISFADMAGVDMESEEGRAKWTSFIQQLSINDLAKGTGDQFGSRSINAVGKPAATHSEGPDGVSIQYAYGEGGQALAGATTVVLAATWNAELSYLNGYYEAENAIFCDDSAFFSPGGNVHRSPYLGRYYDYWSEDGLFSSMMITPTVQALREHGMISCIKHLCANEMEWNRQGVCTFTTEQRLRQESLRAFEGPFTEGGSLGTMSSYNRIGCTQAQCHEALLTGVMRKEWGAKGICITDAIGEGAQSPTVRSVMAGTTMFCQNYRESTLKKAIEDNQDGDLVLKLQEANMYNLYAYAKSNLINGLEADTAVKDNVPWWQTAMTALIAVLSALTLACFVLYVLKLYVWKKPGKENVK